MTNYYEFSKNLGICIIKLRPIKVDNTFFSVIHGAYKDIYYIYILYYTYYIKKYRALLYTVLEYYKLNLKNIN